MAQDESKDHDDDLESKIQMLEEEVNDLDQQLRQQLMINQQLQNLLDSTLREKEKMKEQLKASNTQQIDNNQPHQEDVDLDFITLEEPAEDFTQEDEPIRIQANQRGLVEAYKKELSSMIPDLSQIVIQIQAQIDQRIQQETELAIKKGFGDKSLPRKSITGLTKSRTQKTLDYFAKQKKLTEDFIAQLKSSTEVLGNEGLYSNHIMDILVEFRTLRERQDDLNRSVQKIRKKGPVYQRLDIAVGQTLELLNKLGVADLRATEKNISKKKDKI